MANGKQIYGSAGGGTVSITVPSGVATNTTVTLQDKSGTIARLEDNGGRKNYLINGNFDMWQYGTSQTTSGYGSDDRWTNINDGSTKTHSRVACTDTERALFNASYFSRTVVNSVAGAGNFVGKTQAIENVTLLSGKTITVSFWAKADTNGKKLQLMMAQSFGTGGSPSAKAFNSTPFPIITLTNTLAKYTLTYSVPSIVGKTLGTDGIHTTLTQLYFIFDAGASWNSVATLGQQSGTFDIAQVKIEDGSVATDGWHPYDGEFGGEIQACQRYYEVADSALAGYASVSGGIWGSRQQLKVSKRVTPTLATKGFTQVNCILNAPGNGLHDTFIIQLTASTVGAFTASLQVTASAEL